jgi:polar amino acid transport system permease protein/polar amino acid transport system substrate-binding protein
MEAARSLGLSYGSSMALVVIPQAVRTMIPSIINQFIITLKDTSILSVIGFPELTNVGKTAIGNTFKPLQGWAVVGIMYMIVIVTLSKIAKRLERRVNRGR